MLEKVNSNKDLKKLSIKDKKVLANDIRNYILEVVSRNGGHLASNLGIVELTIALESVFDVSKDKIVWDVGHQCYVHKILNGRKEEFKNIRCFNGISGFPKTCESETDSFNTGHSSTSLSAAMGLAKARDLNKKDNYVIAVIGDGALTGGMAMEALNHIGSTKTNMIIILNDNEMSISKNIGGINELLTRLRSKKRYVKSNEYGKKVIEHIPLVGNGIIKIVGKIKDMIKQLIIPGMYFEEIGLKYLGPVDGHNISDLESLLNRAKQLDGPILIHVKTIKGNGYEPARLNPSKFHGVSPFDIKTGQTLKKKSADYSKIFGEELCNIASKNNKVVAVTAAMKDGTGLSLFADKYPDRFFDVGIAEQHALTFAAGLAKDGMIPFISIYSSFYQRGYDQVIHDICSQNLHVIMCVDRSGIVGADGETHQGLYDMAFFRLIPNITIMAPKNFKELTLMMNLALTIDGPVVIRYPRGGEELSIKSNKVLKYGKSEVITTGSDISILAIGKYVSKALRVADILSKKNISCEVINVRFLKPLDYKTIIKSISKTKRLVTLEDGTLIGGLASAIKELLVEENITDVKSKYFGYPDEFITHGSNNELEKMYKLDDDSIVKEIKKML